MSRAPRFALLLCLSLPATTPGCKSAAGSGDAAPAPRRDTRRIQLEEVTEAMGQNMQSLYDLVQSRHSDWTRPTLTINGSHQVTVYLDRARLGGVEQLRTVPLTIVASARYLTASEAQAEFGLDNLGGTIAITTRR